MKIMLMTTPMHPRLESFGTSRSPALGIYVVGSLLKNNGYEDITFFNEIALKDLYRDGGWETTRIQNLVAGCDILGISSNSFTWGTARELIAIVKQGKVPPLVICGGIHVTYFAEHVLRTTAADILVKGECETSILPLMAAFENKKTFHHIPGISFREGDKIIHNPMQLSATFPDNPMSVYDEMLKNQAISVPIETSRGCTFNCSFCSILQRRNWCCLDVEAASGRAEHALNYLKKVKLNLVNIVDDYFAADLQRAVDIFKWADKHPADFQLTFTARVTDFIQKIDFAGALPGDRVNDIHIGVEMGYDEGLKEIKKGFLTKHIDECFKRLKANDLAKKVSLSFIVGFPFEDVSDCLRTIDYSNHLIETYGVGIAFVGWWLPVMSRLWEKQKEYGIELHESIYDDPLWLARKDFRYSLVPKLSENDIEVVDLQLRLPMRPFFEEENEVKGFEL
jgi:radical SAM superfamily enzyme YgiQ (UPF0313 family)